MVSPEKTPVHILLVDDDPVDRRAIEGLIARECLPWVLRVAETVAEAIECLAEMQPDVALLEFTLPDGPGFPGFDLQTELGGTPSIFITGGGDSAQAVEAMRGGGTDVLLKDPDGIDVELLPEVVGAAPDHHRLKGEVAWHRKELNGLISEHRREPEGEIAALVQAQEAAQKEREQLRKCLDVAGVILVALDRDGRIQLINRGGV